MRKQGAYFTSCNFALQKLSVGKIILQLWKIVELLKIILFILKQNSKLKP